MLGVVSLDFLGGKFSTLLVHLYSEKFLCFILRTVRSENPIDDDSCSCSTVTLLLTESPQTSKDYYRSNHRELKSSPHLGIQLI